jgi:hypothetical protein
MEHRTRFGVIGADMTADEIIALFQLREHRGMFNSSMSSSVAIRLRLLPFR